jgi:hypothetical protein
LDCPWQRQDDWPRAGEHPGVAALDKYITEVGQVEIAPITGNEALAADVPANVLASIWRGKLSAKFGVEFVRKPD